MAHFKRKQKGCGSGSQPHLCLDEPADSLTAHAVQWHAGSACLVAHLPGQAPRRPQCLQWCLQLRLRLCLRLRLVRCCSKDHSQGGSGFSTTAIGHASTLCFHTARWALVRAAPAHLPPQQQPARPPARRVGVLLKASYCHAALGEQVSPATQKHSQVVSWRGKPQTPLPSDGPAQRSPLGVVGGERANREPQVLGATSSQLQEDDEGCREVCTERAGQRCTVGPARSSSMDCLERPWSQRESCDQTAGMGMQQADSTCHVGSPLQALHACLLVFPHPVQSLDAGRIGRA